MILSLLGAAIMPSLADAEGAGPFVAAVQWIEAVALGTIATSIALIAVATIGFLMLSGHLPIRRGLTVILGCFILFGAPMIAAGLMGALNAPPEMASQAPPPPSPLASALPTPTATSGHDPYAGAAVPPR